MLYYVFLTIGGVIDFDCIIFAKKEAMGKNANGRKDEDYFNVVDENGNRKQKTGDYFYTVGEEDKNLLGENVPALDELEDYDEFDDLRELLSNKWPLTEFLLGLIAIFLARIAFHIDVKAILITWILVWGALTIISYFIKYGGGNKKMQKIHLARRRRKEMEELLRKYLEDQLQKKVEMKGEEAENIGRDKAGD